MKTNTKWSFSVLLSAVYASCCLSASAVTIYDNSVNDLVVRLDVNATIVGDELNLAGSARYLTHFSFEYWTDGNVTLHTKLYLNDGPLNNGFATPGQLLYDGGSVDVGPTTRSTLNYFEGTDWAVDGLFIPADTITLVVTFSGVDGNEMAGVDLYDPPIIGSSVSDYWFYTGSEWELREIAGVPVNIASRFEARVEAISVPELTGKETLALAVLSLLVAGRFFRRRIAA